MPFLLLDGHGSRFELPFLNYVTHTDHPWKVCIGVPYGTSLWQVADSKEQNGSFKIALSKIKKELLNKRLNIMMDQSTLLPTDIIPMVNYAWNHSFTRVVLNKKAIADRGWGPLNYNLLNDKSIRATMTEAESKSFASMMKQQSSSTAGGYGSSYSTSIMNTSSTEISDITTDIASNEMNYDSKYLQKIPNTVTVSSKLNFSSGRSAAIAQTLLHEADLLKAREANRRKAQQGKEAEKKLQEVKKLTAMLNFNHLSCEVGIDSLNLRLEMAEKRKEEEMQVQNQKKDKVNERKRKFDEINKKLLLDNLPLDKLSTAQLKILCAHKKISSDKLSISKLKRSDLMPLWLSWRNRPERQEEQSFIAVTSPVEETTDDVTAVINDTGATTDELNVNAV